MKVKAFKNLILCSEDILMEKVLKYAKERNYVKYTSTLTEAWRVSISCLSASMIKTIETNGTIPEIDPNQDYAQNEIAEFGVYEAQKHRSRGVTLGLFLGLMKYYQQAYADLIHESALLPEEKQFFLQYLKRFFDHVEIGFVVEWTGLSEEQKLQELQDANRNMTNEKNKYLTILESIYDPIIIVDKDNNIENLNYQAAKDFLDVTISGMKYYSNIETDLKLKWLKQDLMEFDGLKKNEILQEKTIQTKSGSKTYIVKFQKMLDVSEKYSGTVIIFNDITERLKIERKLAKQYEKLEYYAYTDPMTKVLNRRTGFMRLDQELALSCSQGISLSICYIDIDGLKAVNDTYGHTEGDRLINFIISTIKSCVRKIDLISRMGGDEFLIIFPDCTEADAQKVMQRVNEKLVEYDKKSKKVYKHSFSYGLMEVPIGCNMNANEAIKIVDKKMYQDKSLKKMQAISKNDLVL